MKGESIPAYRDEVASAVLAYFLDRGLRRTDAFLDVGCGRLHSGIKVLAYLDPGRFFGLDREPSCFDWNGNPKHPTAAMTADVHGLAEKKPTLWRTDSFEMGPLGDTRPRFALAQSVLTHILPETVTACLRALRGRLSQGGVFSATYLPSDPGSLAPAVGAPHRGRGSPRRPGPPDEFVAVRYPSECLRQLGAQEGFLVQIVGPWGHPRSDSHMVEFVAP